MAATKPRPAFINGKRHEAVVLFVKEHDEHGRPKEVTVMYDEDSIKLKGGEEFEIVFVRTGMTEKRS